jgi:hypothetical protein
LPQSAHVHGYIARSSDIIDIHFTPIRSNVILHTKKFHSPLIQ